MDPDRGGAVANAELRGHPPDFLAAHEEIEQGDLLGLQELTHAIESVLGQQRSERPHGLRHLPPGLPWQPHP